MKLNLAILLALLFLAPGCSRHLTHARATDAQTAFDAPAGALMSGRATAAAAATDALPPAGGDGFTEDFEEFDEMEAPAEIADPLEPFNRAMFQFNDRLYFWVLKPAARGYRAVVPRVARTGVANFFENLAMPIRLVNCLLQGKGNAAGFEFSRFLINTTFGVLGFGNPAAKYPELSPHDEDLGQTLGSYGIGNGFYIVWPLLGPSTLRDSIGRFGDLYLYPVSYVEPLPAYLGVRATETINATSLHIGNYEAIKDAAISPYAAFRDAYIQNRKTKVKE